MNFKKICINGKNYGVDDTSKYNNKLTDNNVDFADDNIDDLIYPYKCDDISNQFINKTLKHLACCHTLIIEDQDKHSNVNNIT